MIIATFFTTAKIQKWKQPRCPSMDDWIKMLCVCICTYTCTHTHTHTHTHSGLSAMRKKKILPYATTWMDGPSELMLSVISQTGKDKHCMISHMQNLRKVELKKQSKMWLPGARRDVVSGYKLATSR